MQKTKFKSFKNYNEFWVPLHEVPEYENLVQKAISVLIRMPTTYLREQRFSALAWIMDVDMLARRVLETRLLARLSKLADEIQHQRSL